MKLPPTTSEMSDMYRSLWILSDLDSFLRSRMWFKRFLYFLCNATRSNNCVFIKFDYNFFKYGPTLAPFCILIARHLTIVWTFPHHSVVFISGFFSQREGVLGRYAPLVVAVHLRIPLTQTTVDTMSIFEASQASQVKNRLRTHRIEKF